MMYLLFFAHTKIIRFKNKIIGVIVLLNNLLSLTKINLKQQVMKTSTNETAIRDNLNNKY